MRLSFLLLSPLVIELPVFMFKLVYYIFLFYAYYFLAIDIGCAVDYEEKENDPEDIWLCKPKRSANYKEKLKTKKAKFD